MRTLVTPMLYLIANEENPNLHRLLEVMEDQKKATELFSRFGHSLNQAKKSMYGKVFEGSYKNSKNAVLDRIREFMSPDILNRCLIGKTSVRISEAMDQGKFLVFNLRGAASGVALGRFALASVLHAALARQNRALKDRKPVFLCIDEADQLVSKSLERIAQEARKFQVFVTLAQQMTGANMSSGAWRAIEGNTRIRIAGASRESQTVQTLADMVGVHPSTVRNIPERSFYVQTRNRPALLTALWDGLADTKHQMTPQEWATVKAKQIIANYSKWSPPGMPSSKFIRSDGKLHFDIEKSDAAPV